VVGCGAEESWTCDFWLVFDGKEYHAVFIQLSVCWVHLRNNLDYRPTIQQR
jgi:hypothetical protein